MGNIDFCHLHVHTEYSFLDGLGTTDKYAEKANKLGYKYLAITDHGSIDGLIKFQASCKKYGIKPILGCELYIVHDIEIKTRKRGHIIVLVKNQKGFVNLCQILTYANTEGFYYKPRVSHKFLLEHCEGLVISTACLQTFMYEKRGEILFQNLHEAIGNDLYCEIMPHDIPKQKRLNRLCYRIHKQYGTKIISTNDCHYINRTHTQAHEVLLAIQSKAKWNDPKRWRFTIGGLHLKTINEMKQSFIKQGYYNRRSFLNTIEVAEKCSDFHIEKYPVRLPKIKGIKIREEAGTMKVLCNDGYQNIFGGKLKSNRRYYRRFEEEFDLIQKKKFVRYFLIVWELINWCKKNDIMTGPVRGSVGGSLVAYLLGITTVDPIKHKLMFSRFINENRIDLPDIDVDFEDRKRHLVRGHLEELYGEGHVAGVSSFNRMQARAVIRDVSRVFEAPLGEVDQFAKFIEDSDNNTEIQDAIDEYPEAMDFAERYPHIIRHAKKLEGQIKTYSQHAAAIVISREPIGTSGRCNLLERKGVTLINWEKDDTEYVGFMKLDVLGLKLLSVLNDARQAIKENYNVEVHFNNIDLNDTKVINVINSGNTVGVFQFNKWATRNLIQEIRAENFQHLADATALVRPGPYASGMTAEYIKRKNEGIDWERKHRVYEKITKDTYGLLVYQEQVMAVISKVAGLSESMADNIRKVIGKKRDPKEFKQYKDQFIQGCKKTKIFNPTEAIEFWEGLQKWAGYGYNMAHATGYTILAFWCGWLKVYYPTEFICASLTYGAKDKKQELVEEAYRLGLSIVLPKVGISDAINWIAKSKKLYVPFNQVKGIGPVKAVQAAKLSSKSSGTMKKFFNRKTETVRHKGQLGKLLDKIGAYNPREEIQITDSIKQYFDFRIITDPKQNYPKLFKLFDGKIRLDKLDLTTSGDVNVLKKLAKKVDLVKRKRFKGHKSLHSCQQCELYKEGTHPVPPSPGKYNIFIIGEGPWVEEDEAGEGFVGRAGEMLWKSLKGFNRKLFHVTNIWKCYPKYSRKANKEQIRICTRYLDIELKRVKPILILAFGNYVLQYFTNKTGGITDMSGKTTWNEKYGAWITWCLHPAAVLHNPDNEVYYKTGIKNFRKTMNAIESYKML